MCYNFIVSNSKCCYKDNNCFIILLSHIGVILWKKEEVHFYEGVE